MTDEQYISESVLELWESDRLRREQTLPEEQKAVVRALVLRDPVTISKELLAEWLFNIDFGDYLFDLLPEEPFEDYARDPRLRRNPHPWAWKLLFIEELRVNAYVKVHGKVPFRPGFLVVIRDRD